MKAFALLALALALPAPAQQASEAEPERLVGIGAVLKLEDGRFLVVDLVAGGPAQSDGRLRPGDEVVSVAQGKAAWAETSGMTLEQVVHLIRGRKGSRVRLKVARKDGKGAVKRLVITLVRAEIKLPKKAKDEDAAP